MVEIAGKLDWFKSREAKLIAAGLGLSACGGAAVALLTGIPLPVLILPCIVTLSGIGAVAYRAEAALRQSRRASSEVAVLANRLNRLERLLQQPGDTGPSGLRSTVAEVTGTVGLLGGMVRELAKNVAAQNRDVADLKTSLHQRNEGPDAPPAPRIAPEPPPVPRPVSAEPPPKPSLLRLPSRVPDAEREPATTGPVLSPLKTASLDPESQVRSSQRSARSPEPDMARIRSVLQSFEADRVELHLQPVVSLPQRKVRFYEALARLRLADGSMIGPAEFLPCLERVGRAPDFDRRVVERAVAVARHLVARGSDAIVTVNLAPRSLKVPGFLRSLARLVASAPDVGNRIVLELPQQSWRTMDEGQREAVLVLRDHGISLSLDRAPDLQFDAQSLADHGVRFLKLPADLMLSAAAVAPRDAETCVRDFAPLLLRAGIKLVAEHVEREEMVPALAQLGVPLAQGFVFAAPRAVRADVLDRKVAGRELPDGRGRSGVRQAG